MYLFQAVYCSNQPINKSVRLHLSLLPSPPINSRQTVSLHMHLFPLKKLPLHFFFWHCTSALQSGTQDLLFGFPMGDMSEMFCLAIFLKSFWFRHTFCPTEQQDMASSNMGDILFSGENVYLSLPHGRYPAGEGPNLFWLRLISFLFWDWELANIVILFWGKTFCSCVLIFRLVHTVLLMVIITWFALLSRTYTGIRS